MLKGRRVNHELLLLLILVTFGAWAVVWVAVTLFGGEKRAYLSE